MMTPRWAVGVTTVSDRRDTYLPRTLASLAAAGFDRPRLFVDGMAQGHPADLPKTYRHPAVGAWGNFWMGLWELVIRNPTADRFAMFQDDVIAVRDLRAYLDRCRYPDGADGRPPGFWNLYTTTVSEWKVVDEGVRCGWTEGADLVGQPLPSERLQWCKGALGFVFNREAALIVLGSPSAVGKPVSTDRPDHCVDGAVVTAMNLHRRCQTTGRTWPHGWREYVHGPSLLQHTGRESAVKPGKEWVKNYSETFPGEDVSALDLLSSIPR